MCDIRLTLTGHLIGHSLWQSVIFVKNGCGFGNMQPIERLSDRGCHQNI